MSGTRKNIILIGFMGTGKSSVGRALAERFGWPYIDTDAEIERVAGQGIPSIFAERGEIGFRQMETEVVKHVLSQEEQVVSTGGGSVLAEVNRECMKDNGWVIALAATEDTIIARVTGDPHRPLLAGNVQERVQTLLAQRKDAYRFADETIETDTLSVDEIVNRVITALPFHLSN